MLFLDPRAFDVVYGLGSPGDAILNGISKLFGDSQLISIIFATDISNLHVLRTGAVDSPRSF